MKFIKIFLIIFLLNQQLQAQKLYGLTAGGYDYITTNTYPPNLFCYDVVKETFTVKYIFSDLNSDNGQYIGSLIQADNGKMYGYTYNGGIYQKGTIFEYDPFSDTLITIHEFYGTDGINPYGDLLQAKNGKLYGVADVSDAPNRGTLFEYDIIKKVFTTKTYFAGTEISGPLGTLIQSQNGKLYGFCRNNGGAIFEYDISSNTPILKKAFNYDTGGVYPYDRLLETEPGIFYALTSYDFIAEGGFINKYNLTSNLISDEINVRVFSGAYAYGGFIKASNGLLYGFTSEGGSEGWGTLFEYNTTNKNATVRINFNHTNGGIPLGTLMQASNGKLYGMTELGGGPQDGGTLFEYDLNDGTHTIKVAFNGINGFRPQISKLTELKNYASLITPLIQTTSSKICKGESVILSVSDTLKNGAEWMWYKDSFNGTSIASGMQVVFTPDSSVTYYVRAEGGNFIPGNAANISITVINAKIITKIVNVSSIKDVEATNNTFSYLDESGGFERRSTHNYHITDSLGCMSIKPIIVKQPRQLKTAMLLNASEIVSKKYNVAFYDSAFQSAECNADKSKMPTAIIQVTPNPSFVGFKIDNTFKTILIINICDINGKQLFTKKYQPYQQISFGENFKPGVFFVTITIDKASKTFKIVKL